MVTTLTGENSFEVGAARRRLIDNFVAAHGDMGLEQLDATEVGVGRLREALQSPPFLVARKLVVVERGAGNKEFTEQLPELLEQLPDTTDVLLLESSLDRRTSYAKFLQKNTDWQDKKALDARGLAAWLAAEAAGRGGRLSLSDSAYLVARVGLDQQQLSNELDKLLLRAQQITRVVIDEMTERAPQSSVFELLDAAFGGQAGRALELYREQRLRGEEPQKIMAMLAWQLHILALLAAGDNRPPAQLASEAHISPYTAQKSAGLAKRLGMKQLRRLISRLIDIDRTSKHQTYDLDAALEHYLLSIGN